MFSSVFFDIHIISHEKQVVAEIPRSEKRDFLKAMIINCNSPSMVK